MCVMGYLNSTCPILKFRLKNWGVRDNRCFPFLPRIRVPGFRQIPVHIQEEVRGLNPCSGRLASCMMPLQYPLYYLHQKVRGTACAA